MQKFGWTCLFLAGLLLVAFIVWGRDQPSVKTETAMHQEGGDNSVAVSGVPSRPPNKAELRAQGAADAKQKQLDEEGLEEARKAYAKTLEKNLLAQDMDADVDAIGPRYTTLRVTWVLATKLFVYKLTQSEQMREDFQDMRALGFKKFVVRDGYDRSWSWNL
jgi:hypothetical protein